MLNKFKKADFKINVDESILDKEFDFKTYKTNSINSIPKFNKEQKVTYTYDDIQKVAPIQLDQHIQTCVLFWEDVVQFTALGALDCINEIVFKTYEKEKNDGNKYTLDEYPIDDYFNRKNSLIDGERFVYMALNQEFDYEQIQKFYQTYYKLILMHSPFSAILPSIAQAIQLISEVVILFKYNVSKSFKERLKADLYEYFDIKKDSKKIIILSKNEYKSEEYLYSQIKPSAIFTPKANETLSAIVNNEIFGTEIFCNIIHNNLSPEFLNIYMNVLDKSVGPNKTRIHFYEDQIHIQDPSQLFQDNTDKN